MRRIAAVLVLLAAAMGAASSPADAGGVVTTKVVKTGVPAGVAVVRRSCPDSDLSVHAASTTAFHHTFGPGFPPLGHGSLRIDPKALRVPGIRINSTALNTLTAVSVRLLSESGQIIPTIYVSADGDQWRLSSNTASGSGWTNHQLVLGAPATWEWRNLTHDNGPIYPGGPITGANSFTTMHSASGAFSLELMIGSCFVISTHPSYVDDLEVGFGGNTTRYDFESTTGGLTMAANHSTIAAGNAVRLSTVLKDGGQPIGGRTIALWAKKKGAAHFTRIKILTTATTPTSNVGHASVTLKPTRTTTYQWRHARDGSIQTTSSPKKTITVTH